MPIKELLATRWRYSSLGLFAGVAAWMAIAWADWISGGHETFSLLPTSGLGLAERFGSLLLLALLGLAADRQIARLRDGGKRLRTLVDAVPDLVFCIDEAGRYVDFHAPDESLLALPPDEFLGRTVVDVFGEEFARPANERARRARETRETQVWEYRLAIGGEPLDFEARFTASRDGLVVIIIRDVSRRKAIEQELLRSEARLSEAQRIGRIGNWEREIGTGVVWWSDEVYRLLGFEPGEVTPSYELFLERVHPDDRPHVIAGAELAVLGVEDYSTDHRVILPDGAVKVMHDRAIPVFDEAGKAVRLVGTLQDVTRRVELEREVREVAERERTRIARDLHDGVGQTLTGISLGLAAVAQRLRAAGSPHTSDVMRLAGAAQDAIVETSKAVRLLSNVLSEGTTLSTALRALASEVCEYSSARCVLECPAEEPLADEDIATHVYRIAQEAVANALKHGEPRSIWIRYSEERGGLRLEVSDDGKGISEEGEKGFGIENMRFRARMIDGRIEIERRPGGGTAVICMFPWSSSRLRLANNDLGSRTVS